MVGNVSVAIANRGVDNDGDEDDTRISAEQDSPAIVSIVEKKDDSVPPKNENLTSSNNTCENIDESDSIDEKKSLSIHEDNKNSNGTTLLENYSLPVPSSGKSNKKDITNNDGDGNETIENESSNSDFEDSDSGSSEDESGSDESNKPGDGISAYERLRIERIRRNEERLAQLGLVGPNKKKPISAPRRKITSSGGDQKKSKENDVPTRSQPKRSAKKKLQHGQLLAGGQLDLRKNWPLRQSSKNNSRFGRQQKQPKGFPQKHMYSKRYRCGECRACERQFDCLTCAFCTMNHRQGNSATSKRRCLFRMCLRRLVDVEVEVKVEEKENAKSKIEDEMKEEHEVKAKTSTIKSSSDVGHVDTKSEVDKSVELKAEAPIHATNANTVADKNSRMEESAKETTQLELKIPTDESTTDNPLDTKIDAREKPDVNVDTLTIDTNARIEETDKDGNYSVVLKDGSRADAEAINSNVNEISDAIGTKIEGDSAVWEKKTQSTIGYVLGNVGNTAGEKAQSVEKVSIDDSDYFASYKSVENEYRIPKWMDEFQEFLATIPHGPHHRVSGDRNIEHTISKICKLVSGDGITYSGWPEGITFKKGTKIHLGMDLLTLHDEAIVMENKYVNHCKGSLLRLPVMKLVYYKEWIADGKPRPKVTRGATTTLLTDLPPHKTERNYSTNEEEINESKPTKRIVAMTLEERIKPNRIRWSSSVGTILGNDGEKIMELLPRANSDKNKNNFNTNGYNGKYTNAAANSNNGSSLTNNGKIRNDDTVENDKFATNGKLAVSFSPRNCELSSDIQSKLSTRNHDNSSATKDSVDNENIVKDAEMDINADSITRYVNAVANSSFVTQDEKITDNNSVEEGNTLKFYRSAGDLGVKLETKSSQEDDNENVKDELSNGNSVTKKVGSSVEDTLIDNAVDKTKECTSVCESNKSASADILTAPISKTSRIKETNILPSSCAICSGDGDLICCDDCGRGFHSNCHNPKIKEIPLGDWVCRDCTRKKVPPKVNSSSGTKVKRSGCPKREVVINHKLFQGEHDDDCYICYLGGDLICCDFCEKAFHLACHIPPLPFVPEGIWKCCECSAVERKRKSRCGECEACTRDDCGKCKHCLDKPKYGGLNKMKQVCMKRICPYPRFAPPATCTTVAGSITGETSRNKAMSRLTSGSTSISSTGKIQASLSEPRQGGIKHIDNTGKKRGRDRPRKLVDGDNVQKRGRGRPRKSVDGDNLQKRGRGRPRKSVDGDNFRKCSRGRPRKSADIDGSSITGGTSATEKRGRSSTSLDGDCLHVSKRIKIEEDRGEMINQPFVFKFSISSLKSAYRDPESTKIRRIIKNALKDPSDAKSVDKSCELLRKCMKSVESVKTAILFGGVEMICNAMRDHPEKSILQAEACCTLAEILWIFPGIATKISHMGAIDLIVTSIHSCSNNAKVQQMGCGALGALSYDVGSIEKIIKAGGLHAVVTAIERFPKKLAVLKEACYFFQNLIVRSIDALCAVSKSQFIPIIIQAISNTDSDSELLVSACGLIANLAINKEAKELIGISDVIPSIVSTLNTTGDIDVKRAACTALKNLASESTKNQKKIFLRGGLDAVFSAIRDHSNDAMLLVLSFNLMKELCMQDEDVAIKLVKNGGIKIILKAMEENCDLATIQIAACEIIGFLLLKGKSEILAPKLAMAIINAMKNHSEASDVQIQACDALFELSQVPTTRLILKKKETQELLLKAKKHFKSCESDVDDIIAASMK